MNAAKPSASETKHPLSLARHLGFGVAVGMLLAAYRAQTLLPHPLDNTTVQIPPNLPLLATGLIGGVILGGTAWAIRTWQQSRATS